LTHEYTYHMGYFYAEKTEKLRQKNARQATT